MDIALDLLNRMHAPRSLLEPLLSPALKSTNVSQRFSAMAAINGWVPSE